MRSQIAHGTRSASRNISPLAVPSGVSEHQPHVSARGYHRRGARRTGASAHHSRGLHQRDRARRCLSWHVSEPLAWLTSAGLRKALFIVTHISARGRTLYLLRATVHGGRSSYSINECARYVSLRVNPKTSTEGHSPYIISGCVRSVSYVAAERHASTEGRSLFSHTPSSPHWFCFSL